MTNKLPVLLIVFNRFEYTKKVIKVLQKYQPAIIYLAMDGPKSTKDKSIQNRISEYALHSFPHSEIIFIHGESNIGTGNFIPQVITRFFNDIKFGVILEDDCVPTLTFFEFCRQLNVQREKFPQIMAICGSNLLADGENGDAYQLGPFFVPWGWATWSDSWSRFERRQWVLSRDHEDEIGHNFYKSEKLRSLMGSYIKNSTSHESRVWTGFWLSSIIRADGVIATPDTNLVTNIGFQNRGINASSKLERIFTRESFEIQNPVFHNSNNGDLLICENRYFEILKSASVHSSNFFGRKVKKFMQHLRYALFFRL